MTDTVVGKSIPRVDGIDKVTGRAKYTGDLKFAGMVHAAIARSPFPHARIDVIHADDVRNRPDVIAVLTAEQVPPGLYGNFIEDQSVLARGEARYAGEPTAVVIARSHEDAVGGAADLEIEWEPLPALTTIDQALAADAPPVHAEQGSVDVPWLARAGASSANCCHTFVREHGDVERALAAATHVFEDTFEVPAIQAFPLERYECIALWDGSELTIWSATQSPFVVRRDLAKLFNLRLNRVNVVAPLVGGGFGAKVFTKIEPIGAACAFAVPGRPVKLSLSANESALTITRHAARVRLTTGVSADGLIVARDCLSLLNTGAYADAGGRVADKAGFRAPGPYRIDNVRSRSCAVYTNLPPAGAYRGFGAPQVVWAYESQMDLIAERLGMNPLELRQRNILHRGENFSPDDTPLDCDLPASLTLVREHMHGASTVPSDESGPWRVGEGYAVGMKDGGGQRTASNAEVRLEEDGSATVLVGSTEIGQGMLTALTQLVAEELQLEIEHVHVALPDTRRAPYDSGTYASRTLTLAGSAVVMAARHVREQLIDAFRDLYKVPPGAQVVLRHGALSAGQVTASIDEVIRKGSLWRGGQFIGTGHYRTKAAGNVLGARTAFWEPGVAGAQVRVDTETGSVQILQYVSILDAGRAINPKLCEGQDIGAAVQGMGAALCERLEFEGGQLLNASLVDYRLPTFAELPERFETVLIENGDGPGPHGARGIGEGSALPVAAAIGNAIAAATGARMHNLPMTPECIWRAIREAAAAEGSNNTSVVPAARDHGMARERGTA